MGLKVRVIATGEIIEVKVYNREHRLYIRTHGEKTGEIYRAKDLDFNIDGKFAENCLNGIKQGIVHDPDYWEKLLHQYAGMAMQGMLSNTSLITILFDATKTHDELLKEVVICSHEYAHALVEKLKENKV